MQAWIRRPQEDEFDRWTKQPQAAYWRLIGEGGGGKTSLLARFFEEAEDRRFPAVFLEANRCLDRGERDGVTLLLNLETVNTPTFDSARRLLLGVKSAFQAALDEAGGQTKANWDRISELAECGAEGAGAILKGARDVAKVLEVIFGKGREASRAQDLAQPEQFLLKALADDMAKGGIWLIDTWEQADAKPFTTRLEFPAVGRLRTPLRGKPTEITLAPWLDGAFAWMFTKAKSLVLIAGREAPGRFGDSVPPVRGVTERTQPWNEREIAAFLADALPEINHGDAPLSDLRRRTGGVPLLVDWIVRLVGDVAREQGGVWNWTEWPGLVRDFAESDRYGLIHYAVERVVKQSARIADVWKLALVDELTPAVANILFPPTGRDGPTGRALLRELERLGLARQVRGQSSDRWLVHDVTRAALESYAAHEEKLGGPDTLETHRALADHYDREAGWTKREEVEYWLINLQGKVPDNWVPTSIANDQFATLLRAAFHRSIVALHGNAELREGNVKPSFIYEMARRLTATIVFSPPWVRAVGGLRFGDLSREQIEQLLNVFRKEGGLEGGFKPEDAHLFHRMTTARSMADLEDVDFGGLIEKYHDSRLALNLIACNENISNDFREMSYRSLIKIHPQDPNYFSEFGDFCCMNLGKFDLAEDLMRLAVEMSPKMSGCFGRLANFLTDLRKDHDEAERYYRLAVEANPRHANNLGNFANFLTTIRQDHYEAEKYHRFAIEADPRDANSLGNFAVFLKNIRQDHDEAEKYYRLAVKADPRHANNLGNFAIFLASIRGAYDEAEQYYRLAVEADPNQANSLANLAGLLFARDSVEEAESVWQRALALADTEPPALSLELWFYAYAHLPHRRDEALREVTARLERGERSPGFDLSRHIEAARRQGHPEPSRVAEFVRRIAE
jgi:Tfp pilus assembly protein PilF